MTPPGMDTADGEGNDKCGGNNGMGNSGMESNGMRNTGMGNCVIDRNDGDDSPFFEVIDHTADVGIRAIAPDLSRCFETAARGMFHILSDGSRIEPKREYIVEIDADSYENALTDFLSELLFLFDTERVLFMNFSVELTLSARSENRVFMDDGTQHSVPSIGLKARCRGEPYDENRHNYPVEIKAVTHHMLQVRVGPPAEISVLFDI